MKNALPYLLTLAILLLSIEIGTAQETKNLDNLYKVTDTIDGQERVTYYLNKASYEKLKSIKDKNIAALKEKQRLYESDQRTGLANQIKEIDERLENNPNYTQEMAQRDKESTAALYAERINKYNELIDAQIAFEKVSMSLSNGEGSEVIASFEDGVEIAIKNQKKKSKKVIKTTSGLTLAFGYNFINGDNLGINDFSYGNNNLFSIGVHWKRALNESQTIRLLYGIDYQTQGTELNGNRAFTINNPDNTQIERLSFNADKAKFRQDQLVFPVSIEFSGTDRRDYEDGRVRYTDYRKFKFGLGGYAGFNTSSRMKYKFESEGENVKQTTINAFDNNVLLYGVDAYIGVGDFSLFGRMALNDIFKEGSVDGQYVAFGIRWHM